MEKLYVIFVLALTFNIAFGISFRHKRQTNDDDDENSLDDRYGGWDRVPGRQQTQQRPWNQNNQRPWNQGGNNGQQNQGNQGQWNQGGNNNQQGQNQGGQPQPTPSPTGSTTTTQSNAVAACISNCPVTAEYNPVCGTNMVQYPNPGRLTCAQACGVSVSLLRASPCPTTTTAAPPS